MKKILILLAAFWIFSGCTEEEVIPRTNPRFSVAMVQEVDASGAEFAANIYDYGSEEILEYGFVYGSSANLSVTSNDLVKELGRPTEEFKLKGNHSMKVGGRYYVAAFLKTATGVVYSQPFSFTSQGSDGFILDRIEAPAQAYFGDTLRVFGSRLSKDFTNYSVKIKGVDVPVSKLTESSFDIVIPRNIEFQEGIGLTHVFDIELTIAGKTILVQKPITFKAPIIQPGSGVALAYTDELLIQGDYLYDEFLRVKYTDAEGNTSILELKSHGEKSLTTTLKTYFTELNPVIELVIRGNSYKLGNLLKLKETKLLPGQKTTFHGSSGEFILKGENFNPHMKEYNKLEFSPDFLRYWIHSISPTEMHISYEYYGDKSAYRNTELFLKNGGVKTANSMGIEWTAPAIPIIIVDEPLGYFEGRAVSLGDKGYFIGSKGIFEIHPATRSFTKVSTFTYPSTNPEGVFAIPAEGKIYFAPFVGDNPTTEKKFFVFDPATKNVTQLASIPSQDNSFQSIVYSQGYLYYQADHINRSTGQDGNIQRYRFDLARRVWEKLPSLSQPDGYHNFYTTFEWNNETYSVSLVAFDDVTRYGTGVFKFNQSTFTWDLLKFFENQTVSSDATQSIVLGNKVYLKTTYDFFELDLNSWQLDRPDYLNERYSGVLQTGGFKVGQKFYYLGFSRVLEYEPKYFY